MKYPIQDLVLLFHGFLFTFIYCIKDDRIYDEKTKKKLNIAAWILGVLYVIFILIMSVYLAQKNY